MSLCFRNDIFEQKIIIGSPHLEMAMDPGSINLILLMLKLKIFLSSPSTFWIKFGFPYIQVYTLKNSCYKKIITVTQTRMFLLAQLLLMRILVYVTVIVLIFH